MNRVVQRAFYTAIDLIVWDGWWLRASGTESMVERKSVQREKRVWTVGIVDSVLTWDFGLIEDGDGGAGRTARAE